MKEMVYKEEFKKELLHSAEYKGFKFAIYSYGVYPMAFVENKPKFKDTIQANESVSVHGKVTFIGKLQNDSSTEYFGWDYGSQVDFVGYYDPKRFSTFKKWSITEVFDEIKKCIDKLVEKYGVQTRFI